MSLKESFKKYNKKLKETYIDPINAELSGKVAITEESYTCRKTGGTLYNSVVTDGSAVKLQKVQGNTVRTTNEFDISKLPTGEYLTKTDRDVSVSSIYAFNTNKRLKDLFPYLKVGKTYTFYADIQIAGTTPTSSATGAISLLSGRYILAGPTGNTSGRRVRVIKNITQDYLDVTVYFYGYNVTWKDLMCIEGEYTLDTIPEWTPFFTGLKNASFQGIKSFGGNLLPVSVGSGNDKGISYTRNEDGSFTLNGTATADAYITVASFNKSNLPSGQYYLSSNVLSDAQLLGQTFNNGKYISQIATGVGAFTVDYNGYDTVTLFVLIKSGTTVNGTIHPMLNVGDTAQETAPHKEDTLLLPEAVELGKWDYIKDNQIVKGTKTITLKGNEGWNVSASATDGVYRVYIPIADIIKLEPSSGGGVVCNSYNTFSSGYTWDNNNGISTDRGNLFIYDENFNTNDISLWNAHLAELANKGTPLTVAYQLETPTITPFTLEQAAVGDTVKSYKNGIEIVQGNDNSAWVENTLTQKYDLTTMYTKIDELAETKLDKKGGYVSGNLYVQGDLSVAGTTHTVNQETLTVEDNLIVTNGSKVDLVKNSGIAINKNLSDTYGIMLDPVTETVNLGVGKIDENGEFVFNESEAQAVATRSDMAKNHIPMWDANKNTFVDSELTPEDITNKVPKYTGVVGTIRALMVDTQNNIDWRAVASFAGTSAVTPNSVIMTGASGEVPARETPTSPYEATSKKYVEDLVGNIETTKNQSEKTAITLTPTQNNEYYYGQLTSLNLSFANDSTIKLGDMFYIAFQSGATATILTVDSANAIFEDFVPNANSYVEIMGKWNGSKWLVLFNQTSIGG